MVLHVVHETGCADCNDVKALHTKEIFVIVLLKRAGKTSTGMKSRVLPTLLVLPYRLTNVLMVTVSLHPAPSSHPEVLIKKATVKRSEGRIGRDTIEEKSDWSKRRGKLEDIRKRTKMKSGGKDKRDLEQVIKEFEKKVNDESNVTNAGMVKMI